MTEAHWTQAACDNRHNWLPGAFAAVFALLTLIIVLVGWSLWSASQSSAKADTATRDVQIQTTRVGDERDRTRQDFAEVKLWIRTASEKMEVLNNSVQRLVQQSETRKEKP